jgi:[ribosomal protein S5]-alanine N-acetyltransferase
VIRGEKIHLRLAREADLATLADLLNDVEAAGPFWPVTLVPEPTLRRRYEENGLWGDDFGQFLICDEDDRVVGEIIFFETAGYLSELEIAYRIFRPEDRGKGATSEALALMTSFLFSYREVNRLRLMIEAENEGSRRVAEKCGYRHEGTARGCMYNQGRYHDLEVFAILRHEALSGDT